MRPFEYVDATPWNFSLRVVLAVSSSATFGMGLAQVFTNIYTKDGTENIVRWGLWSYKWCQNSETSSCVESALTMSMCDEWTSKHRTSQAFSIIVCVFSFICGLICWGDALGALEAMKWPKSLPVISTITLGTFALIQWSLLAAFFHQNTCDLGALSDHGYRLSSSFALTICIFFSTLLVSLIALMAKCTSPKCT